MAKTIENATANSITSQQDKPKPQAYGMLGYLLAGLALIAALLALGITFYNADHLKKQQRYQLEQQHAFTSKQEQLISEQQKMAQLLESQAHAIATNQHTAQEQLTALNKQLDNALAQKLYQNQDWLLLKARYYLELAQINSHWSDHYAASVALLQAADSLLSQINEPKIFSIRQAIAKEIAQLNAIAVIDFAGILSQLDAAQASIDHLMAQLPGNNHSNEQIAKEAASGWQANVDKSLQFLQKLVVIRHNNHGIQPLLSPVQEALLKEQIRLNLQQAQWAILNNDIKVYQLALKQAIANINKGFNQHTKHVSALLKQLKQLQQVDLIQEKPAEGLALSQLNALIDAKNKPSLTTPTNTGESR